MTTLMPPRAVDESPVVSRAAAGRNSRQDGAVIRSGEPSGVDLLKRTIEHAVLAPSSHNTQPWRFKTRAGALELHLDRSRVLPVTDPACREMIISCGAALQNIRIALRHRRRLADVEILPFASNPNVLARIRPGATCVPSRLYELLFAAIPERHTNRGAYLSVAPGRRFAAALGLAAELEGAWLRWTTDDVLRSAVADLVAAGDRVQGADPAFRRELAAWMRPNDHGSRDGMPGYSFGLSRRTSRLAPGLLRWFPWGRMHAVRDRTLALDAPILAVLGTAGDSPRDWMAAGQALQFSLLLATAQGLSASFLNQPVQVPALRARLRALLGSPGHPQLILRMGYAARARPTPRRSVAEVFDSAPGVDCSRERQP